MSAELNFFKQGVLRQSLSFPLVDHAAGFGHAKESSREKLMKSVVQSRHTQVTLKSWAMNLGNLGEERGVCLAPNVGLSGIREGP